MTNQHDEQTETSEYSDIDNILIRLIQDGDWTPGTWITKTTAFVDAKAALEAWSRQQTARVLDELLKQKQGFYASHDLNHWREIVPVAAIEALRVGLERSSDD